MPQLQTIDVLLVEDNVDDADIARRVLSKSEVQAEVHVAGDGAEALDFLFRRGKYEAAPRPALVVLDVGLPRVGGIQVLRLMRADPDLGEIPVAVLTGSLDRAQMEECLDLGTNMYILKSMSLEQLVMFAAAVRKYWRVIGRLRGE